MFSSRKSSAPSGGYNLTNSLRFRSSASAYLNRTPASAGNQKTWTWSAWVKRGNLTFANGSAIFNQGGVSSNYTLARFDSSDRLDFQSYGTSSYNFQKVSTAVYRDPSAWYHIVFVLDATNTQARIYVNGTEVAYTTNTNPSNADQPFNQAALNRIGYTTDNVAPFDGYLAEINFIDGQALTPSSFGETSATTGVWIPKKYTGTYGTNGFYLPFTDNSALTTSSNVGLGKDFSGNGNYWTTNNISITSGSTYDSMTDVPTLTSATAANYATLNPVSPLASGSITNANLTFTSGAGDAICQGTFGMSSGKWYWEVTATNVNASLSAIGIIGQPPASLTVDLRTPSNGYCYISNGNKGNNNTTSSYGATYTSGDVIGIALDMDAGTLVFYKNNSSQGTAYSSLTGTFTPALSDLSGSSSGAVFDCNFGQRPFAYTPPTGFVRLNTFNLPTPTIGATASTQAGKYFNTVLYTGNGSSQTVTGFGFDPDMVWHKGRSVAYNHSLVDVIRGNSNILFSNTTDAEANPGAQLALATDGATVTYRSANLANNENSATYVIWGWKANGTGVTNTAGSITSTVSANTSAGFSIVTWTGNGTQPSTVGHGLGVAPKMIFVKSRSNGGTYYDWAVYNSDIGAGNALLLNSSSGSFSKNSYWVTTAATSTVFTLGSDITVNQSSATYVAYCFAQVAGYSAFGSYTGNGSTDGTFVYTGFRPRYLMIKRTDSSNNWVIQDTSRDTYNVSEKDLYADTSGAEATYAAEKTDILSNGFKQRQTGASMNASGGTYIYMAFAENPFKYANAR
jgi:hypothetical protein